MNGHDYSSSGHENEGHKSRSRSRVRVSKDDNAVGLTSVLDQGQFFSGCRTTVESTALYYCYRPTTVDARSATAKAEALLMIHYCSGRRPTQYSLLRNSTRQHSAFSKTTVQGVPKSEAMLAARIDKKLSYRRGTARCVVSIEILPIATQQCRNYLYDKS